VSATFGIVELAVEAEREVRMREHVFGKRVAAGTMRAADAERKIALMREIARRLRTEAEAEAMKGWLL